ncbi:alpha-amylase, putative [Talaromyces stipitatus ATCC 10500]|uniref:alpha-amylase n=1 Tax=Talaromyces stipitatus (strain ATCC 10500 / CBS 375.48 / QM 6759 / NRRL 1006) TaxID=441959 RepID=B8MKW3_TALSN|nr:alpha-amylase, putative [Talaromyces stipitatus ATCC 10500]EED14962.1 alpha-amylase, putative [Talaromyces stipitatus ATCC 10500]
MKVSFITCATVASLLAVVKAATPDEWRSRSVYFLLTDRFARSDNSTTAECDAQLGHYCGGSWQGIINQLDYIQNMGFTAIWITPVTEQLNQSTADGESYHGYWQQDINSINSNYGTAADLKALASALHDRDMYLMVDVVANHMGYAGAGTDVDYSVFNPFNSQDYFHPYCEITDYNNLTMVEQCWEGDNTVSLPDLDTESTDVQNMWYTWIPELVANYSIDGLRLDSALEVQKDFWPAWNNASGVYCVGEVFNGDAAIACPYQNYLDGVLNYPMYFPLLRAFESSSGSISDLYDMINTVKSDCADSNLLGTFVENHDNPRFANYTSDFALAKNALAFTILSDGIPIIYSGQEQHYSGGSVPLNREATWLSGFDTTAELYQFIAKLNKIRNYAIQLDKGYTTYKANPIYQDTNNLAIRKGTNGSQVITVLSNSGADASSYSLAISGTNYTAGTVVTELISCTNITVSDSGDVSVPMASGLPSVLYPASKLNKDGHPC